MCGRYTVTTKKEIIEGRFGVDVTRGDLKLPRYNVAPSQEAPVLVNDSGKTVLSQYRWGLVPSWSKDLSLAAKMINARSETLLEKPTFKRLVKKSRCLVISDGFYEWVDRGPQRVPLRVVLKSREPFAFAGLWDEWNGGTGPPIRSFTIITMSSKGNSLMEWVHHRMPVLVGPEQAEMWLKSDVEPEKLIPDALTQYPAEMMDAYEVSRIVNSPKNDVPKCVEPADLEK